MTATVSASDGVLPSEVAPPAQPLVECNDSTSHGEVTPAEAQGQVVVEQPPSSDEPEGSAGSKGVDPSADPASSAAGEVAAAAPESPVDDGAKQPAPERLTSGSTGNTVAVVAIVKRSPTSSSPEHSSSNGNLSSPLSSGNGVADGVDPQQEAVKKYNEAKARIFSEPAVNPSTTGEGEGGNGTDAPRNENNVERDVAADVARTGQSSEGAAAPNTAAPSSEAATTSSPTEGIPPNVGTPVSITVGVNPRKAAPRGFVAAEEQEEYRRESVTDGRGRNGRGGHQDPYNRRPVGTSGSPSTASHQPYANTVLGTQPPAVQVPLRGQQPSGFPNPAMPGYLPPPPPQFPQTSGPQLAPQMRYPTGQPYAADGSNSIPLPQPTMPFANPAALPPQAVSMLPGGFPPGFPAHAAGPLLGTTSVKFGNPSSQTPSVPPANNARPPINVEAPRVGVAQHNSYQPSTNIQPSQPYYPPQGSNATFRPETANPPISQQPQQGQGFYGNPQHQGTAAGYPSVSQSHREGGHDRDRGSGSRRDGNGVYSNPQIATPPFQGPGYPGTVTVGSGSATTSPLDQQPPHQSAGYSNYPMAPPPPPQQLPHSGTSAAAMSGLPPFQPPGMVPNPQLGMAGLMPGSVQAPLVGPPPPAHQLFPSMAQEADYNDPNKQRHQRYSHDTGHTRRRGGRGGNQRQDGDSGHGGMSQDDGSYGQSYTQHQPQQHQQQFQQPQPHQSYQQQQQPQQQYVPQHSYPQANQGYDHDPSGGMSGNQHHSSQSQSQHYDGSRDRDGNRSGGRGGRGGRGSSRTGGNNYQGSDSGVPPAPAYPSQHSGDSMYYSAGVGNTLQDQHQHSSGHSSMNYSRAGTGQSMQTQSQPQSYGSAGSKGMPQQATPAYPGYEAPPRPPPGFPTPPGPQTTGYYASGSASLPPPPPPPPAHSQSTQQYSTSSGYNSTGMPSYGSTAPPPPPPPTQQSPYQSTHSGMSQWSQPAFLPPPLQPHQTQGAPPPPPPPPPPPLNSSPVAYAPSAPTPDYNAYSYSTSGTAAPPYSAGTNRQTGSNNYSSSSGTQQNTGSAGVGYSQQQHSSSAQSSAQMMHGSGQHHGQSQNHHVQHQGYTNSRSQNQAGQASSTGVSGGSGGGGHQQHQQLMSSGGGKSRTNAGSSGMYPQTYSPSSASSGGSPNSYPPNPVQPQSIDGYIPQERVARPTAPQAVGVTSGGPSTPVNFGAPIEAVEKRSSEPLNRSGRGMQDDATPNVVQRVRK